MGDYKQNPMDKTPSDGLQYTSSSGDTISDHSQDDSPSRGRQPGINQHQPPPRPATYGGPFPGYPRNSQFAHGPFGNFANPPFGQPRIDNRPSRSSQPPQNHPLSSFSQPMTNNVTTHYQGYSPNAQGAAPNNPFNTGFPPQTPRNNGTGSPFDLPVRTTPVAATPTPAAPLPQQGSNRQSSPSIHRSPSPDSEDNVTYACMSARFKPRGNFRIVDRREDPPMMTDRDRAQVVQRGPLGQSDVIKQGVNSGMGWMGYFDSNRPNLPLTRCPIQVRRGRGGPGRGGSSVFEGYPPYTQHIPAGLSLEEICQRFPNHVWGDLLRVFKSEGWGGHEIYNAFNEDVKTQCATNAKKTKDRPHNFLQAAMGREIDMMFNEDRIYRRIIKNKNKGRKKTEPDEDDRKDVKRRRLTQPEVVRESGNSTPASVQRSGDIGVIQNDRPVFASASSADPYRIVHGPQRVFHNGTWWVPEPDRRPQPFPPQPQPQPPTPTDQTSTLIQIRGTWTNDSFTSQEQWEEYTRSQPLVPNEQIWVSNMPPVQRLSGPSVPFGGQLAQGTTQPNGYSGHRAGLPSTRAVTNNTTRGTDCDLTTSTGNPFNGNAQSFGASMSAGIPNMTGIPANNQIRSPESVTAADNKDPNDQGDFDDGDFDTYPSS